MISSKKWMMTKSEKVATKEVLEESIPKELQTIRTRFIIKKIKYLWV